MGQLLRRAAPGVAVAGVALSSVWLLDPALQPAQEVAVPAATGASAGATTDSQAAGGSGGSTSTGSGSDASGSSGTSASGSDSTGSGSSGSAATSSCSSGTNTRTGDEVTTRWGPVQVRMTFAADGTVCAVEALTYPDGDPHSARISQYAVPLLDARATADGVTFDGVSGATYTSEGYRQSMQSILDRM